MNGKANKGEIFNHLKSNLGEEALILVLQIPKMISEGKENDIFPLLEQYDASLGRIHIGKFRERRYLGVYRPLVYIYYSLKYPHNLINDGREIVFMAGSYLEGCMKSMVKLGLLGRLRKDNLPLGVLVKKGKKILGDQLYSELDWFAQNVMNYAKHEYFINQAESPEHSFEIDEALALYFIARKLGLKLEEIIGKSTDDLEGKYVDDDSLSWEVPTK